MADYMLFLATVPSIPVRDKALVGPACAIEIDFKPFF
jgi:hypothetical protein